MVTLLLVVSLILFLIAKKKISSGNSKNSKGGEHFWQDLKSCLQFSIVVLLFSEIVLLSGLVTFSKDADTKNDNNIAIVNVVETTTNENSLVQMKKSLEIEPINDSYSERNVEENFVFLAKWLLFFGN